MVLIARKDLPVNNLAEFIAYVKANAGSIQYGSAGVGSTTHLGCTVLNTAMGVSISHIPYRGGGPAAADLITGQIHYLCLNMGGATPLIAGDKVKAIATLTRERAPNLPNLPTAHEQGLAGFDVSTWNAFFLPKGTPTAIVKRLNAAISAAIDAPALQSRLHEMGVTPVAAERRSPEYLARFVQDEIEKVGRPNQGGRNSSRLKARFVGA